MTSTYTQSTAYTFTTARAKEVMGSVHADFLAVAAQGWISRETILRWHEEIEYAVLHEVVASFELQFKKPDGTRAGLEYVVHADGSVSGGVRAGGLDLYGLPRETKVTVCLSYRQDAPRIASVREYLHRRGWGANGQRIGGEGTRDRAYASSGYAIQRNKIGDWT